MICPICKNTMGFAYGTCIECGYNYIDNTYHKIEVCTDELRKFVPNHIMEYFISEHNKHKKRK